MMDLTFLIPTRIETEDRLRNIISSVSYLLRHVQAKVIVKEVSSRNTFKFRALPEIKKYVDTENLTCLYGKHDPLFCKSKVLNDFVVRYKVVTNYDADCILPISSYTEARDIKDNHFDVVYPYGCGIYQWKAEYNTQISISNLGVNCCLDKKRLYLIYYWLDTVYKLSEYIDVMMNENFVSWGCEDRVLLYDTLNLSLITMSIILAVEHTTEVIPIFITTGISGIILKHLTEIS